MGAWVTYREFAAPVLIVKPPGPLAERARDMVLFDPELQTASFEAMLDFW